MREGLREQDVRMGFALERGDVLDHRFEITRLLGAGGTGVVLGARDLRLDGAEIALKLVAPHLLGSDGARARFQQEVLVARQLCSRHIVRTYEFDELSDGTCFIVMELIVGATLAELCGTWGDRAPRDVALRLLSDIAAGLGHAHARGIIHRDLKPHNVLIRPDGVAAISDFGMAALENGSQVHRESADLTGTPHYMAPERFRGASGDKTSDVYSFGVLAYELFAGRRPFAGDTFYALGLRHLCDAPPRLSELTDVPDWLDELVSRCLAKDPANRYADGGELADVLERHAAGPHSRSSAESTLKRIRRRKRIRALITETAATLVVIALLCCTVIVWKGAPIFPRIVGTISLYLGQAGLPLPRRLLAYAAGFELPSDPSAELILRLIYPHSWAVKRETKLPWSGHDAHIRQLTLPLIEHTREIDGTDRYGRTILTTALLIGQDRIVEAVLHRRPDLDKVGKGGLAALPFAAVQPNDRWFRTFLELGADPSVAGFAGETTFHALVTAGLVERLEMALSAPALGDASSVRTALALRDLDGRTALHRALSKEPELAARLMELLLEHGADPLARDIKGRTALHHAALFGRTKAARIILRYAGERIIDARDLAGRTPLHLAFLHPSGQPDGPALAQLLIQHGADVNAADTNGATPLEYAAAVAGLEEVKLLLASGAEPRRHSVSGGPLHLIAARRGRATVADVLRHAEEQTARRAP